VRANLLHMARPLDTLTDDQLVARVRLGDDDAYAAIVRRYRPALVGFAGKLLGDNASDAEDVVQDALVRALAALRASDRAMVVRPWLYMIARNRAFDHLRTPAARHRADGDERLALVPNIEADPAIRVEAREELERVVAEIGRLPERQRLALVRRELGGSTHAELAAELGTTVPATKSLILRARGTLTEALAA
jgi:RNA polymerase sigma factor (sigma-70 family)